MIVQLKPDSNQAADESVQTSIRASADSFEALSLHRGAGRAAQARMLAAFLCVVLVLCFLAGDFQSWVTHRLVVLFLVAGVATWRWSWFMLQNTRAVIYRYFVYPKIRRGAELAVAASGPVPEVTVMATTYHEKSWITRLAFNSVFSELRTLKGLSGRPKVVVATGCDEDEAVIKEVYKKYCDGGPSPSQDCWPPELILLREENGKRAAIAAALRKIAQGTPNENGAVVFLDGDTIMQPGFLGKVLPLFRVKPAVAAVTTNEDGYVKGPAWFAEWISLRLGLRHRTMCSVALSGKLLCLTGRLSVFRAGVATNPTFIDQIEHDTLEHWLWGSFEMLSGDDKSTWYWLSRHGHRMLYVPDAMATTIEVVEKEAVRRAWANIRRWSGNSLRHSWRAIQLGPRRLGWFPWWSLIDQRSSMLTVLFGPTVFALALCSGHVRLAAGIGLWLALSRLAHSAIAWRHGRRWSAFYMPLTLLSDWAIAVTKLWVLFHPAKQAWLNRGARTLDSTRRSRAYRLQTGLAHYFWAITCASAIVAICTVTGILPLAREARLFLNRSGKYGAAGPRPQPAIYEKQAPGKSSAASGSKRLFEPGIIRTIPEPRPETVVELSAPVSTVAQKKELLGKAIADSRDTNYEH